MRERIKPITLYGNTYKTASGAKKRMRIETERIEHLKVAINSGTLTERQENNIKLLLQTYEKEMIENLSRYNKVIYEAHP